MFEIGDHHEKVPEDVQENLDYRLWLRKKGVSKGAKAFQDGEIRKCEEDIFYYVNSYVWQVNPQHLGHERGPFILWDFQKEVLRDALEVAVVGRRDTLWEKSRELGASWLALILCDYLCLFHTWKKFLCLSHNAEAVDKTADSDSLFWKLDFMHSELPAWMREGIRKRKMGFSYGRTHSILTGQASTIRSGVGGRATLILLDEFGRQRDDYAILGDTADTGPRLIVSTHYGLSTAFYELSRREGIHKVVMHWSQHPEKNRGLYRHDQETNRTEVIDRGYPYASDFNFVQDGTPAGGPFPSYRSPWYDSECVRRANSRDVAMHLDIDPQGSQSQFFDPREINILIQKYAQEPWWTGDIEYDPDTGRPIRLVASGNGKLRLWCHLLEGRPASAVYGAGSDISWGTGATPSVYVAGNASTGEKVAEYANSHIRPHEFGTLCVALCRLFRDGEGNGAKFCWESQGPGRTFGDRVIELGYRNVYYTTNEHVISKKPSDKPGWYSGEKKEVLEEYRTDLKLRHFLNRSKPALKECMAFKYDGRGQVVHGEEDAINDPSGARVNHSDRVIADALCNKMRRSLGLGTAKPVVRDKVPLLSLAWRQQYRDNMSRRENSWN